MILYSFEKLILVAFIISLLEAEPIHCSYPQGEKEHVSFQKLFKEKN